jgi:phosphoribosylaminoimidazole (AIR) synthetase
MNIQRLEAEATAMFLRLGAQPDPEMEELFKDSESGVGMTCDTPEKEAEQATEEITQKRLGMFSIAAVVVHLN